LHAALNVLEPGFLNNESKAKLDALLQTELHERAIVEGAELAQSAALNIQGTRIALWQGDITTIRTDAIVNAANKNLLGCFQPLHNCIDNAIHTQAGVQLRDDCWAIMQKQQMLEPTGMAKVTRAYNLPSKFVIHTVGPIVKGNLTSRHENELRKSYLSCLNVCASLPQIQSIALCCISTGVFGYPYEQAAETAFNTTCDWLNKHPLELEYVVFNVFSDQDWLMYESLMGRK
jgi:O-acetyl-ADP-ribose deacetylase (regulator of RNase III)